MKRRRLPIPVLALAALLPVMSLPPPAAAMTRVSGSFTLEESYAAGPEGGVNLVEGGVNFDIIPQTKKNLRSRFSFPVRFSFSDREKTSQTTPSGDFALDMGGDWYNLNLQYGRTATVSSTAELTDATTTRAALAVTLPELPSLSSSYSETETTSSGATRATNTLSLFSDYRYQWLNFRGGYASTETTGGAATSQSSSLLYGMGGSYEILPRTTLSADYDFNGSTSEATVATGGAGTGTETETTSTAFRVSADSRPLEWFSLGGSFTKNASDFEAGGTSQQFTEVTAGLTPAAGLRLSASLSTRNFNDIQQEREVTARTFSATYNGQMLEKVQLGMNASRSYESDPGQGDNIRDNLGLNMIMDLTPRIAVRANFNINRNENGEFVSAKRFDAAGTLAERDALAADPARTLSPGFIFFDSANNDLYTLVSPFDQATATPAVWSLPTHLLTEQFSVSKNIQMNMIPTDRTSLTLSYSSSAAADMLEIVALGNQSFNGSFTYSPNRRTNYSLSGTATLPERGNTAFSAAGTMSYRLFRGHQLNLSYARQSSAGRSSDNLSGTLGLALRKRTALDIVFAASQPFATEMRYFIKLRFTKSF